MTAPDDAIGLLVSVSDLHEMELARIGGADIVDLKQPSFGALGAWSTESLVSAMMLWEAWDAQIPPTLERPIVCATIGDQPMVPALVLAAAERVADAGVPVLRIGFTSSPYPEECIEALALLSLHCELVGVLFADREPDFSLLGAFGRYGFTGVMIDTADKSSGPLTRHLDALTLGQFIAEARRQGLSTGLAGALTADDIATLAPLRPDYLGFRSSLCEGGRHGRLDAVRLAEVRAKLSELGGFGSED
jgi:(5-formylfuran-3-yl)methyl phosphate synthase